MCNFTCYCASHKLLITYIQKAGIDVVRALFPWNLSQLHTWEIVYGRNSNDKHGLLAVTQLFATYKEWYFRICFEHDCKACQQHYVRPGVVYWRTAAREKLLNSTDFHRKHATYIIFQLKSLVSILMHLCNMLLELGNWYWHPDLWHWERYSTIKLFPIIVCW